MLYARVMTTKSKEGESLVPFTQDISAHHHGHYELTCYITTRVYSNRSMDNTQGDNSGQSYLVIQAAMDRGTV